MAQQIAKWRITSLILVPELLAGLVGAMEATGARLPLLTLVAVGGARTPPALIARARALGLPVRQGYGLTECASVVSLEVDAERRPGSAGSPLGSRQRRPLPKTARSCSTVRLASAALGGERARRRRSPPATSAGSTAKGGCGSKGASRT